MTAPQETGTVNLTGENNEGSVGGEGGRGRFPRVYQPYPQCLTPKPRLPWLPHGHGHPRRMGADPEPHGLPHAGFSKVAARRQGRWE